MRLLKSWEGGVTNSGSRKEKKVQEEKENTVKDFQKSPTPKKGEKSVLNPGAGHTETKKKRPYEK